LEDIRPSYFVELLLQKTWLHIVYNASAHERCSLLGEGVLVFQYDTIAILP